MTTNLTENNIRFNGRTIIVLIIKVQGVLGQIYNQIQIIDIKRRTEQFILFYCSNTIGSILLMFPHKRI